MRMALRYACTWPLQEELARLPPADTAEGRQQQRQVGEGFMPVQTGISGAAAVSRHAEKLHGSPLKTLITGCND